MNTAQTLKPVAHFNHALTYREAAKIAAADQLHRLQSCINWLLSSGISVVAFNGYERNGVDHLRITVRACPQLYMLFGDDCTWCKRTYDGKTTRFTWVAQRFGVRIEWEETQC